MKKVYISRHRDFTVTIRSPKTQMINGQNIQVDNGKTIVFSGGLYQTEDQEEMDLLEKSSSFEADFFDVNKQQVQAKAAEVKSRDGAIKIIEGAIVSNQKTVEETNDANVDEEEKEDEESGEEDQDTPKKRGRPKKK